MRTHLFCYTLLSVALSLSSQLSLASSNAATQPIQASEFHGHPLTQQAAHDAILKMAGSFDVIYEFEELYPLSQAYSPKDKKISKGRDVVLVIDNTPTKIALQHFLLAPNGEVIKHWRQDWQYQPQQAWQYIGAYRWQKLSYRAEQVRGKWLQTVWNADDSPRYAALGQWQQQAGVDSWQSELTIRPLPRREYTKRQDYDLLLSRNQHLINAQGWVQQEDNVKYQLGQKQALVREFGTVRYLRSQVDDQSVRDYWLKNQGYWQQVQQLWQQAINQNSMIGLTPPEKQSEASGHAHYLQFLQQAQQFAEQKISHKQLYQQVKALINKELIIGKVQ